MQKVTILSFSVIHRDGRVLRQIKALSSHYDLTVIGFGRPQAAWQEQPNIKWISLPQESALSLRTKLTHRTRLLLGKLWPAAYDYWYWHRPFVQLAYEYILADRYDAIHANDWDTLPLAAEVAKQNKARLIFDAHEYAPLQFEHRWPWRTFHAPLIRYMLQKYTPCVDASITVVPLIAERYKQEFNLSPIVVLNAPDSVDLPMKKINSRKIKLVHHGGAMRHRRLETMIEAISLCDQRYTLHFMLVNVDADYIHYLHKLADDLAPGRITFHNPVPPDEIVQRIAEYDIGFCVIAPTTYGYLVSLPNKFFDYIAAGLAVCVGPSPSMAEIVQQYGCGCIAPSFQPAELAAVLNRLDAEQLQAMQLAARRAARELNADKEMRKVVELYHRLLT